MKDYNEMASAVFRRRDEYLTARKKRTGIIIKTSASVCALLLVAVVGIGVWKALPDIPSVKPTDPTAITAETTQVQENPTASQQITDGSEQASQETTDTFVQQTPTGNTQESTLPFDPTEPVTEKPTMPTGDQPQTNVKDPTQDSSSSMGDTSSDYPNAPPTEDYPTEAPVPPAVDPTEAPTEAPPVVEPTIEPTEGPVDPTEAPTEEPIYPTEEPIAPTEAPTVEEPTMSELYIECNGETVVAEKGDVVTVTVELQADKLLSYLSVLLKYDNYEGYLKLISEEGLTSYEKNALHVPNIDPDYCYVNYSFNTNSYKGIKVIADGEYEDIDFSQKKVLFTYSFEVKKTGYTKVELEIDSIKGADGKDYYLNGEMVNQGNISFDMHLDKK